MLTPEQVNSHVDKLMTDNEQLIVDISTDAFNVIQKGLANVKIEGEGFDPKEGMPTPDYIIMFSKVMAAVLLEHTVGLFEQGIEAVNNRVEDLVSLYEVAVREAIELGFSKEIPEDGEEKVSLETLKRERQRTQVNEVTENLIFVIEAAGTDLDVDAEVRDFLKDCPEDLLHLLTGNCAMKASQIILNDEDKIKAKSYAKLGMLAIDERKKREKETDQAKH